MTTSFHPRGVDTFMHKTIGATAVNRVLHHAHVVLAKATSLRLTDGTAGKGAMPIGWYRREISSLPTRKSAFRRQGHHLSTHRVLKLSVDTRMRNPGGSRAPFALLLPLYRPLRK